MPRWSTWGTCLRASNALGQVVKSRRFMHRLVIVGPIIATAHCVASILCATTAASCSFGQNAWPMQYVCMVNASLAIYAHDVRLSYLSMSRLMVSMNLSFTSSPRESTIEVVSSVDSSSFYDDEVPLHPLDCRFVFHPRLRQSYCAGLLVR